VQRMLVAASDSRLTYAELVPPCVNQKTDDEPPLLPLPAVVRHHAGARALCACRRC
jgi:hypothetical protein